MEHEQEIALLKLYLLSFDWKVIRDAADRFYEIDPVGAFEYLVGLLNLDNKYNFSRNIAAYKLREIGDPAAMEPLFKAALKKENINYNGSIVYALEGFKCPYKFKELFQILFYHGMEAQLSAYAILSKQKFTFTDEDLVEIGSIWAQIKLDPTGTNYKQAKEMVDAAVRQYLPYLEPQKS